MRFPVIVVPHREELLDRNRTLLRRVKAKIDFGDLRTNACWMWTGSTTNVRGVP